MIACPTLQIDAPDVTLRFVGGPWDGLTARESELDRLPEADDAIYTSDGTLDEHGVATARWERTE